MNSQDLREHLALALKGIQEGTMDIDKAKAIGDISQVVINLAKVEVDFVRANGGGKSEFFSSDARYIGNTATGLKVVNGSITTHTLKN